MKRCVRCGKTLESGRSSPVRGVCTHCFEAMSPIEKREMYAGWSLHHSDSEQVVIDGHSLLCPVCGQDKFWQRKTALLTPAAAFLNFNWGSKVATNYICDQCGYIYWFLREATKSNQE